LNEANQNATPEAAGNVEIVEVTNKTSNENGTC